jgi:hypothetical protein
LICDSDLRRWGGQDMATVVDAVSFLDELAQGDELADR